MNTIIQPAEIAGSLDAPPSKSAMQRACAVALLNNGITTIYSYGKSNDDNAALSIVEQLGAHVKVNDSSTLSITSTGKVLAEKNTVINCGESGLSLRMFTPIAALSNQAISIQGKGSLLTRPVAFLTSALHPLNVKISAQNNTLPITITGPLIPANITLDGAMTSQLLTGILMTIGSMQLQEPCTLTVENLKSTPYIDLTLSIMEHFKFNVPTVTQYQTFTFNPKPQTTTDNIVYQVEGDWSNAAFLLVAGAIGGNITVKNLDVFTTQADKKILEALQDCGCRLSIEATQITAAKAPLKAFHFNATHCPDLFPPLVALAAYCQGTSVIEGVSRLFYKESNRAQTLQSEFGKLGVVIEIQDDNMLIKGGSTLQGNIVNSHNDHRIAMAMAVAAIGAAQEVTIQNSEAVNKSYPEFFKDLIKVSKY